MNVENNIENIHTDSSKQCIESYSFHLVLFADENVMYNLWLPEIFEGIFYFTDNYEHRFIRIIANDGIWIAECKRPAFFEDMPLEKSI